MVGEVPIHHSYIHHPPIHHPDFAICFSNFGVLGGGLAEAGMSRMRLLAVAAAVWW